MVAPDRHVGDVVDGCAGLQRDLRLRAIVVQARHRGEIVGVDVRCVALGDQRVGVGRVADHQHLYVTAGVIVDRLALYRENRGVGFEQVLALHAGAARTSADQQRVVGVLEGGLRIVGGTRRRPAVGKRSRSVPSPRRQGFHAGVISSNCRITGWSSPSMAPEAIRKTSA
jgi:hypothetical protein